MREKPSLLRIPIALTIAGSDSGGGAGLQADLKTFSANGVYGASVVTAVTAQNTLTVAAVHEIPSDIVAAQIKTVLDDLDVDAIKIGMLFSHDIIAAVVKALENSKIPVVLDPVMIAKSGDALLQDEAVSALKSLLLPKVDLLTPNLPEAARLLGVEEAGSIHEMKQQAGALLMLGPKAVLLKGGHGTGLTCTDILFCRGQEFVQLDAPRQNTKNTHGTGCTYSAAIAAELAKGKSMELSVRNAHAYLQNAIINADQLSIGSGHGPVHHFHNLWAN
ncbi:MAG: bifunctional hydroxymethylpyrimidine kinase/phosphomethylpyrimidine kinase [Hyphomicrobiales bacterium]|nr:MAG: bifunctional hydroxymethylpyrimidine kinase/phosphomethylpyrimidine kinase [Hyphomicrobiales bacterium]